MATKKPATADAPTSKAPTKEVTVNIAHHNKAMAHATSRNGTPEMRATCITLADRYNAGERTAELNKAIEALPTGE